MNLNLSWYPAPDRRYWRIDTEGAGLVAVLRVTPAERDLLEKGRDPLVREPIAMVADGNHSFIVHVCIEARAALLMLQMHADGDDPLGALLGYRRPYAAPPQRLAWLIPVTWEPGKG